VFVIQLIGCQLGSDMLTQQVQSFLGNRSVYCFSVWNQGGCSSSQAQRTQKISHSSKPECGSV